MEKRNVYWLAAIVLSCAHQVVYAFVAGRNAHISQCMTDQGSFFACRKSNYFSWNASAGVGRERKTSGVDNKDLNLSDSKLNENHATLKRQVKTAPNKKPNNVTSKKTRKSQKSKEQQDSPSFWRGDSDEIMMHSKETGDGVECKTVKFVVRGKPVPLRRHRTSKGFMYNPSAKVQTHFRQVTQNLIFDLPSKPSIYEDDDVYPAIFDGDQYLIMNILFRLPRPLSHFVNNRPGPGRLKPKFSSALQPSRTDIDNLAKFVLDSLNGILYEDDRQVVSLQATKIFDMTREGATEICVRTIHEDEMSGFLTSLNDIDFKQ